MYKEIEVTGTILCTYKQRFIISEEEFKELENNESTILDIVNLDFDDIIDEERDLKYTLCK